MGFLSENQTRGIVEVPDNGYYARLYTSQAPTGPNAVTEKSIDPPRPGYVLVGIMAAGNATNSSYAQVPSGHNLDGQSIYASVQGNVLRIATGPGEDSLAMVQGAVFVWLYYAKNQEAPPLSQS